MRKEHLSKIDKFLTFVIKTDSCWNWIGRKRGPISHRYGAFYFHGKTQSSHRFSYQHFVGELENNLNVCHTCDNTLCVNPAHLFLGTHRDNMKDKMSKNRGNHLHGESHPNVKLSDDQVRQIRLLYNTEDVTHKSLALKFKVAKSLIHRILKNEARVYVK